MIPPTDEELKEITLLESAIKPMQERLSRLKEQCREYGSLCTENYVCTVSAYKCTRIASLEDVMAVFGIETLEEHDLIRQSTSKMVKVTLKSHLLP